MHISPSSSIWRDPKSLFTTTQEDLIPKNQNKRALSDKTDTSTQTTNQKRLRTISEGLDSGCSPDKILSLSSKKKVTQENKTSYSEGPIIWTYGEINEEELTKKLNPVTSSPKLKDVISSFKSKLIEAVQKESQRNIPLVFAPHLNTSAFFAQKNKPNEFETTNGTLTINKELIIHKNHNTVFRGTLNQRNIIVKQRAKNSIALNIKDALIESGISQSSPFHTYQKEVYIDEQHNVYIISPYHVHGDLREYILKDKLTKEKILTIVKKVLELPKKLKKLSIAHLDMKATNLIYQPESEEVLCIDAGLSINLNINNQQYSNARTNKPHYSTIFLQDPNIETLTESEPDRFYAADRFAAGITALDILLYNKNKHSLFNNSHYSHPTILEFHKDINLTHKTNRLNALWAIKKLINDHTYSRKELDPIIKILGINKSLLNQPTKVLDQHINNEIKKIEQKILLSQIS